MAMYPISVSNLAPLLFVATMGADRAAAAVVVTRIANLHYRVSQSCFGASLVFYSFTMDRFTRRPDLARRVRLQGLALYSAAPSAFFALTFLMISEPLAQLYGETVDPDQIAVLLAAYPIFVPGCFAENFFRELLAAHRQDLVMVWPSTLAPFAFVITLAYVAANLQHSAFLTIASREMVGAPLAIHCWCRLRSHIADLTEVTI